MSLYDPDPEGPPCINCGARRAYGKRTCVDCARWPGVEERAAISADVKRFLAPRVPTLVDLGPLEDDVAESGEDWI